MLLVSNTPNHAGVAICGDCHDLEALYEALHRVVGDEDEFAGFDAARNRVLGVCYDLRHALMGDREVVVVDNGIDEEMRTYMSISAPHRNVYLKINVLWPELLFVMMALNDFIRLHAQKLAKKRYEDMLSRETVWDESIAMTRLLQSAIVKCMRETVSGAAFGRMINLMNKRQLWCRDYTRQYLDILNCRFLDMTRERRLKSIPTMAKRLAEQGEEYTQVTQAVKAAAKRYNTWEDNIKPPVDYPEDFEW